jgi:hypothetical protein
VSTIKYFFANAGIWPVSFKAVKKKLKKYGKKKKRDTGLQCLEYSFDLSSESDLKQKHQKLLSFLQIIEEFQLFLLKSSFSYDECRRQLQELESKANDVFSLLSRAKASITIQATNVFLMRGSLYKMKIIQARAGAVAAHKKKLNSCKSIQSRGSILADDAIDKIKKKRKKEIKNNLRRAKTAITRAENKAKNILKERGVQAQKNERARLLFIQHQALGVHIPNEM